LRLRKKSWVPDALREYREIVFAEADIRPGEWLARCGGQEVHVEIGTGRGSFITGMAQNYPDRLFVGIEATPDVVYDAVRKATAKELNNVRLMVFNAQTIDYLFAPGEVDRLYLNFSDPWPKRRHAKRRLTHAEFLTKYRKIIKPGGSIWFKTDNAGLFEFSLNSFADFGLRLSQITFDLHTSDFTGNVMTEYEKRFTAKGAKIFRCEARFVD
jgi:tRNA (guanine-N7-)-methyltransferase